MSTPRFIAGTVDPSAGAGVAVPISSLFLRDNSGVGEFWVKTGAGNTAWTRLVGLPSQWTAAGITDTTLPVVLADPTGVVIDTTTYDNPFTGVGKMTTVIIPANDTAVLAVAIAGDPFPRWLLPANGFDGLYLGDGTTDPVAEDTRLSVESEGDGSHALVMRGSGFRVAAGPLDATRGRVSQVSHGLNLDQADANFALRACQNGPPTYGGEVNDLCFNRGATGLSDRFYICTSAGVAGVAVWGQLFATPATYAASNVTTDRTYDANATTVDELADVLGTLIADLRAQGIVA